MNFNAIIALLILKGIITDDEGTRLVEHLNDKPQSTVLRDAIAAVAEVIGKPRATILPPLGPVGPAQVAEEMAARSAPVVAPVEPPAPETPEPTPEVTEPAKEPKSEADKVAADAEAESNDTTKSTPVKKSTDNAEKK
jgi:hypothetical protein